MPDFPFSTYTGVTSKPLWGFRADTPDNPIVPEDDLKWLRDNPRQVARIHRFEVLLDRELDLSAPIFVLALRVLDDREAMGWRLATVSLPGPAPFSFDAETTLDDKWPDVEGKPDNENEFVLIALNEAAYTGELWAEPILRSLVLPDTSGLDPEDWGLDFTPYKPRT